AETTQLCFTRSTLLRRGHACRATGRTRFDVDDSVAIPFTAASAQHQVLLSGDSDIDADSPAPACTRQQSFPAGDDHRHRQCEPRPGENMEEGPHPGTATTPLAKTIRR